MPPKPPHIFYKPRIIIYVVIFMLILFSLTAYSVNLNIQAESLIIGGSAEYNFDAGTEKIRGVRLITDGDDVDGVNATCVKPPEDEGNYAVSITFFNGVEGRSGQVVVSQGKGVKSFTVTIYFDPISYYPSPRISGECWKVQ
jgi:hypothetical protein